MYPVDLMTCLWCYGVPVLVCLNHGCRLQGYTPSILDWNTEYKRVCVCVCVRKCVGIPFSMQYGGLSYNVNEASSRLLHFRDSNLVAASTHFTKRIFYYYIFCF